ncbi:hypothetical protein EZJ43_07565 [Pedobacter changchengzhani]|uniref:Uncharacterized protein n=1 Tax=Pedobacter changchengzhani TaxID=2529274 RepID=A0A4R5ML07_9SPHI|nr:hypothetical protein [Pedobacter changchengzhani]TDG36370.1 hypothetical protein EZJ43_07565 [Pedobacter changchengzhani]
MEQQDLPEDAFEPNSDEALQFENELLKLKMRAELGASMFEVNSDIPAGIENAFLKNILAFEKASAEKKVVTVYEKLLNPEFLPEAELKDGEVTEALLKLEELLHSYNIVVGYAKDYSDRIKYKFLTEELFDVEIDGFDIPDMFTHFNYEEFHPDHLADLISSTEEFISDWFQKSIDKDCWIISEHLILPDAKVLEKSVVMLQINNIFENTGIYTNTKYEVLDSDFTLMDDEKGMGFVEGRATYYINASNGTTECIEGPFKLYFSLSFGLWQIFHIVFPGFYY